MMTAEGFVRRVSIVNAASARALGRALARALKEGREI